jgi:hypothetical protein
MGMEKFTPFYKHLDKKSASKEVCSMISQHMLPHCTAKQIETRITNKSLSRSNEEGNPIKVRFLFWFMNEVIILLLISSGKKYYWANKVAPPIHHSIQPFDRYSATKLCDVPPNLLPERWQKEMLKYGGKPCRSRKNSRGHPPAKTKKKKLDSNNSKTDEQIAQASQRIPPVYSPVLCELVETDNNNSCTIIDLNNLQPTEVIIILSEFVLNEYFQPLTVHIILAF